MKARTFTKQQLCIVFGLHSQTCRTYYYKRLRSDYFTDDALQELGMTLKEYNEVGKNKPFTFMQTLKIIKLFQIETEEIEQLC